MKALYDLGLAVGLLRGVGAGATSIGLVGVLNHLLPDVFPLPTGPALWLVCIVAGALLVAMAVFADTHYKAEHIPRRILEAMKRGE